MRLSSVDLYHKGSFCCTFYVRPIVQLSALRCTFVLVGHLLIAHLCVYVSVCCWHHYCHLKMSSIRFKWENVLHYLILLLYRWPQRDRVYLDTRNRCCSLYFVFIFSFQPRISSGIVVGKFSLNFSGIRYIKNHRNPRCRWE